MRAIICGGRDYEDKEHVYAALDGLLDILDAVIQGGAAGADLLAAQWAWDQNLPVGTFNADWKTHGKAAGPIRNQEMLDFQLKHHPGEIIVIAFPGGTGTEDMCRRATAAGVPVFRIPGR